MLAGAVDWTTVIVATIATAPAILAALLSYLVHRQIKTPSGDNLGTVVERTHETAVANHLFLRTMNGHGNHDEEGTDDPETGIQDD